jgi:hypothetical protein
MNRIRGLALGAVFFLLAGCAAQTKYVWGNYEGSLYSYYKAPGDSEQFTESLHKAIAEAETTNRKVAPGIYAEYGHMLQRKGRYADAIRFYEMERQAWPESTILMNTMIKSAETAEKKAATPGKAHS